MLIKSYGYYEEEQEYKMWAVLEIDGYPAYIYGDENLLESLIEKGFIYSGKQAFLS